MMWGDDPGSMGTGETTLMGPSIWGNPHSQAVQNNWGHPAAHQPSHLQMAPHQNGVASLGGHSAAHSTMTTNSQTFHQQHNQHQVQQPPPKSAWDMPGTVSMSQQQQGGAGAGGWGQAPPVTGGWGNQNGAAPVAQNTAGGWGVPPPTSQQGQWGGTSGTSPAGTSFAEAARKNVPQPVHQQPPQGMRPRGPSQYDPPGGAAGWGASTGARVDQGTPWEVGSSQENSRPNEWRSDGTSHWGTQQQQPPNQLAQPAQHTPNAGPTGWGGPSPPASAGVYGAGAPTVSDHTGAAHWNRQQSVPNDVGWGQHSVSQQPPPPQQQQQNAGPPQGWGNQPAEINAGRHQSAGPDRSNWDPNPQHPSMWVPPAPAGNSWMSSGAGGGGGSFAPLSQASHFGGGGYSAASVGRCEQRDDMMWHDPNPKTKKVQADKGTGCWGDPTVQGPVSRWKLTSDDGPTEQSLQTPASSTTGSSVWDSTPVGGQTPVSQAAPALVTKSASIAAPGWGGAAAAERTGGTSDWDTAPTTGWNTAGSVTKTGSLQESGGLVTPVTITEDVSEAVSKVLEWPTVSAAAQGKNLLFPPSAFQSSAGLSATGLEDAGNTDSDNVFSSNPVTPLTPVKPAPGKGPEMTLQDLVQAQGGGSADLRHLTQQIAEQLRVAVNKGLINISILNQPLPQNVLLVLNQLLQRVPKLEQAKKEFQQLQSSGQQPNEAQVKEQQRLQNEIGKLEYEIRNFQEQISKQTNHQAAQRQQANPADGPQTPSERSKLDQWKNASGDSNGKINPSASAPNLEGVENALGALKFDNGPWGPGMLVGTGSNWSPPSTTAPMATSSEKGASHDGTNGDSKSEGGSENGKSPEKGVSGMLGGTDGSSSQNRSGTNSATPTPKIEGPKEFVPGQKWEWKDPKEVAEDPNATPGSLKNALSVGGISSTIGMGFPQPTMSNQMSGGFGGGVTPSKMNEYPRAAVNMGAPNNMYNPGESIWGMRNRPPMGAPGPFGPGPNMGGPPGGRMGGGYNRSISTPTPSAFAPYNQIPTWVVLSNLGQADEMRLKSVCSRMGRVTSFVCPPGATFACLKFSPETPLDHIVPRLSQEVGQMGISVQVAKEPDVDNLIKSCFPGPRPSQPMMPPGHGMMWPEQGAPSPWGAPPFPGGHGGPDMIPGMMPGMPPPQHMPHDGFMPHNDGGF